MALSKREKMIAIGVGAMVGLYLLDSVFVSPLFERLATANSHIDTDLKEQARGKALFDNRLRAQRRWNEIAGDTLKTDASTAEGQLLNRVRDYATAARLDVASLKPDRAEKEKGFQRITIRANATGSMAQVSRFLYALREADFPLRVSDLRVSSRKDGTDDLAIEIGVSTIFVPPTETPEVRR
ncbi:MAG: type II secretion system protein GspM [Tepidisphaeraceae bacterium]